MVVLNSIELLTATESQIANLIGKTKAIDTVHSYLVETLATPATMAVEMGRDFTNATLSTPTRLTNIVQEMAKTFVVTSPQNAVQHYHGQNETSRQLSKALKDFGNSLEVDLVVSTLASGTSGTTAKMNKLSQKFLVMLQSVLSWLNPENVLIVKMA